MTREKLCARVCLSTKFAKFAPVFPLEWYWPYLDSCSSRGSLLSATVSSNNTEEFPCAVPFGSHRPTYCSAWPEYYYCFFLKYRSPSSLSEPNSSILWMSVAFPKILSDVALQEPSFLWSKASYGHISVSVSCANSFWVLLWAGHLSAVASLWSGQLSMFIQLLFQAYLPSQFLSEECQRWNIH